MENIESVSNNVLNIIVIIVVLVVVVLAVFMTFSEEVNVNTKHRERFAVQAAQALLNSQYSEDGTIIWERVKDLGNKEPVFGCNYGTYYIVEPLATASLSLEGIKFYTAKFGYKSEEDYGSIKLPIGVKYNQKTHPGILEVRTYQDIGTLITCGMKRASENNPVEIGLIVNKLEINCEEAICIIKKKTLAPDKAYKREVGIDITPSSTIIEGEGILTIRKNNNGVSLSWNQI